MKNRLNIPPELEHLIEKREREDRRGGSAERSTDPPTTEHGPDCLEALSEEDRRTSNDRRRQHDQRQQAPQDGDDPSGSEA